MPKNVIGSAPFPPVVLIDTGEPITCQKLLSIINKRADGVTLCVRYESGAEKRGGYFFHVHRSSTNNDLWSLLTFEKKHIADVPSAFLCRLINHCTGQMFNEECFSFCTNVINLRSD